MNTFSGKISDDYGWEVAVFHELQKFSYGVIFIDGGINWDRFLGDHSPRYQLCSPLFQLYLRMFNYTVIEINIYYLHHRDEEK